MGNPPDPPSPAQALQTGTQTAQAQQGFNLESWLSSLIGQEGPWGSLSYEQTGTTPEGNPMMTAKTKYAPGIQGLFDQLVSNKSTAGGQTGAMLNRANYGAQSPEDVIGDLSSGITGGIMNNWKSSLDPFFETKTQQLHTALSNRGLVPGQPAYDNAMREMEQSQGLTINNLIGQTGTKAYELASGMYKMPAELAMMLGQYASPASATQDFTTNLPSVQPANLVGATANAQQALNDQWKAQTMKYGNMMGGIGQIGGSLLGGWASSPAGGAALTSMFALSDERYKTDIIPTGERVNGIPIYSFRFPWEQTRRLGMLAQEVEQIMPEAVTTVDDVKFVDYSKTLAV
jgi:hypothetical protein